MVDRASVAGVLRRRRARMVVPRLARDARADLRGPPAAVGAGCDCGRAHAGSPRPGKHPMMRAAWGMARNDLAVWLRSPAAIATSLLPALGMGILVAVLTNSVGQQPVALVAAGHGPQAVRMAKIIRSDTDAYLLEDMTAADA